MKSFDLGAAPSSAFGKTYERQWKRTRHYSKPFPTTKTCIYTGFGPFYRSLREFLQMCISFPLLAETGPLWVKIAVFS
ncbi:hypothetical protein GC093_03665 [Paenibacillus sp. LMG 31456]|uniref:Uncharacterized protein n=1 Tax=Paenibacillus foliorum TaxID=2654974 RepID=A0A972JZ34_9BACL|nr:hypothetical protein [Paenibacillus foliorum]NOU92335.1 hypothetical protein [Paenibacillus foliorum]